jgi:hypothetical protein
MTINRIRADRHAWLAGALALCCVTATAAAQEPTVEVDGDEITIRGCVLEGNQTAQAHPVLVWTRGGVMLSNAMTVRAGQAQALPEQVFYWLEGDDPLAQHVGQRVEVEGELGDFEKGEVEIERDGAFTNIELKLDGETEHARVPTAWLAAPRDEGEFDIVARKIEIDDIDVLGACAAR